MKPTDTDQLLLRLQKSLIAQLRADAERFGYESGNQVAGEIVRRYHEFWHATKEAEFKAFAEQKSLLSAHVPPAAEKQRKK